MTRSTNPLIIIILIWTQKNAFSVKINCVSAAGAVDSSTGFVFISQPCVDVFSVWQLRMSVALLRQIHHGLLLQFLCYFQSNMVAISARRYIEQRLFYHYIANQILLNCFGQEVVYNEYCNSVLATQLSTLSGIEHEYQPNICDALWLGSKGKYGSFHLWINVDGR